MVERVLRLIGVSVEALLRQNMTSKFILEKKKTQKVADAICPEMHILRCSLMLSHCSSACGHFEKPLKRLSRNNHLIGNQSAQRIVNNHLFNYAKLRCTAILISVKKCSLLFRPTCVQKC